MTKIGILGQSDCGKTRFFGSRLRLFLLPRCHMSCEDLAAAAAAAAVVVDCTDQNLLSNWPVGSCGSGAGAVASKIAQNCLARKIQNYLAYYCAAVSKLDQSCCAYLYQS